VPITTFFAQTRSIDPNRYTRFVLLLISESGNANSLAPLKAKKGRRNEKEKLSMRVKRTVIIIIMIITMMMGRNN